MGESNENEIMRRSGSHFARSNDISMFDLKKEMKKFNDRATISKYVDPKWEKNPNHPDNLPRSSKGF